MDNKNLSNGLETVTCTGCGATRTFCQGVITEQGKLDYKCEACSELVLERRVAGQEDVKNGRRLLID